MSSSNPQLSRLLECPICMEQYIRPKQLPCQHTFCLECITKVYVNKSLKTGLLTCPICKKNFQLRVKNSKSKKIVPPSPKELSMYLQTNITIAQLLDIKHQEETEEATERIGRQVSQEAVEQNNKYQHNQANIRDIKPPGRGIEEKLKCGYCLLCMKSVGTWMCATCEKFICIQCLPVHIDQTTDHRIYDLETEEALVPKLGAVEIGRHMGQSDSEPQIVEVDPSIDFAKTSPHPSTSCPNLSTSSPPKSLSDLLMAEDYAYIAHVEQSTTQPIVILPSKKKSMETCDLLPSKSHGKAPAPPPPALYSFPNNSPPIPPRSYPTTMEKVVQLTDTPHSLAVDNEGNIYVSFEGSNKPIRKYDSKGEPVIQFGNAQSVLDLVHLPNNGGHPQIIALCRHTEKSSNDTSSSMHFLQYIDLSNGQMMETVHLAQHAQRRLTVSVERKQIVVADTENDQIRLIDYRKKHQIRNLDIRHEIEDLSFGGKKHDCLYILCCNSRSQYALQAIHDTTGIETILDYNTPHLKEPKCLAVDTEKRVYIGDPGSHCITIVDAWNGNKISSSISVPNIFTWRPVDIVLCEGFLYIADAASNQILKCSVKNLFPGVET